MKFTRLYKWFKKSIAIIAFLALWEILPRLFVNPAYLPPISSIFLTIIELFKSGEIFEHLFISLQRAFGGFGLAFAIGVPLGLLMGWFKTFEEYIDPLLQAFRQTAALALFPVFILFFGIGESSKVAIIFWGTVWPILLNTISGVKDVDPLLVKSAKSLGISGLDLFRKVIIHAAIPSIMTGIRIGATFSILLLIVAEYVGAKSGLGALVINSQYAFLISKMYAAILILALLGLLVNYSLVALERKATKWKEQTVY